MADEPEMKKPKIEENENREAKLILLGPTTFAELVKHKGYVDKTELIKLLVEESNYLMVTAPRRFGKTSNMDTFRAFLELPIDESGNPIEDRYSTSNYKLFKDSEAKIFKDEQLFEDHFGKYPILFIDFSTVKNVNTMEEFLEKYKEALHSAFTQHRYLLNCSNIWKDEDSSSELERKLFIKYVDDEDYKNMTTAEIESCLTFLANALHKHYGKPVFVLFDDYDSPLNNVILKHNINTEEVFELVAKVLETTLKNNESVGRFMLTGLKFYGSACFRGIKRIEIARFLDADQKYQEFYGYL